MSIFSSLFDDEMDTGPSVNCDGTPMLNNFIDVEGKIFGDCGSDICSSIDTGMDDSFGCGIGGSFGSCCEMDDW